MRPSRIAKDPGIESILFSALLGCVCTLLCTPAKTALQPRLGGQAVYDTDLNITWLADAGGAGSSRGLMTWAEAVVWAANFSLGGATEWRLPATANPDPTCDDSATSSGFNCTGSEMGHLFYTELGGSAGSPIGNSIDPDLSLFSNLDGANWWSGTSFTIPEFAWDFRFANGRQGASDKDAFTLFAWAVHDGDVFAVAAEADLTVAILDFPDPVPSGSLLTYEITIFNHGPQSATNVILEFVVSGDLTSLATGFDGCSVASMMVTCSFSTLDPGNSLNGEITGIAGTPDSTIMALANVSSDANDSNEPNFDNEQTLVSAAVDTDADGVNDAADNCTLVPNADQRDTNGDAIGNVCDPDVTNDCTINFPDLSVYQANFFQSGDLDTDNNGDGFTNFADLAIVKAFFFGPPGPSADGCN